MPGVQPRDVVLDILLAGLAASSGGNHPQHVRASVLPGGYARS